MTVKMLRPDQLTTYWDKNPRKRNQEVVDGLYTNMLEHGFDSDYPLTAYEFGGRYHLSDGHHRLEGAIQAALTEVPVDVRQGNEDMHLESLYFDNMNKFDIALGNIGQMFSLSEKREAIKGALTIPGIWTKSDRWLAKICRTSHVSVKNYRDDIGVKVLTPSNPLNLSQKRLLELEDAILMGKRQSEDGQWQPVPNCKLKPKVEEIREARKNQLKLNPDAAMIDQMIQASRVNLEEVIKISVEDAVAVRRQLLRQLHPDRADLSKLTEPQRQWWNVVLAINDKMSESLINQLGRKAGVEVEGGRKRG